MNRIQEIKEASQYPEYWFDQSHNAHQRRMKDLDFVLEVALRIPPLEEKLNRIAETTGLNACCRRMAQDLKKLCL